MLNETWVGPVFHKPSRPVWGALRCGTIASCHFSFWRHEQTKHQHTGHCPLHQLQEDPGTWACEMIQEVGKGQGAPSG